MTQLKTSILVILLFGVLGMAKAQAPTGGTLTSSGTNNVCGTATGTLSVTGYFKTIVGWEVWYNDSGTLSLDHTINNTSNTQSYSVTTPTYYRVKVQSGSSFAYSNMVLITANPLSVGGTTSGGGNYYNQTQVSGTLTVAGYTGTIVRWEKISPGQTSYTPIANTSSTYNYTVTGTTSFHAVVQSASCTAVNSVDATINFMSPGNASAPATCGDEYAVAVSLQNYNGTVRQWEYSTDGGTTWTVTVSSSPNFSLVMHKSTKFRAQVDLGSFGLAYSTIANVAIIPYSQVNPVTGVAGQNYVRQQKVSVAGLTDPTQVDLLSSSSKHEGFSYMDGIGRTIQQVSKQGSPAQKDIVGFAAFDGVGRNATQYLPYVTSQNDGTFKPNFLTDQQAFYSNGTADKITDSPYPYAITVFEQSPLSRTVEQGMPGQDWQPGNNHTVRNLFTQNVANEVRQFETDGSSTIFYPANQLAKTQTTDENGNWTQTFTDKLGRLILKKSQLDASTNSETYYIYNASGGIKYIISPKGVDALKTALWSLSQSLKDQYVYQFVYDNLGRMVEKKTPGQAAMYYCYDRLDRVVLVQDANTRALNKWIYIKYDRLGRPIIQGLYTDATNLTRPSVQQNVIDPLYAAPTDKYYEDRGAVAHGYTNQSFPITNTEVLVVNYYDNYDFDNNGTNDCAYVSQGISGEGVQANAFGLPTGGKRLVLGTTTWLYSYGFYDDKGRTIQVQSNNHLSTAIDNITTNVYDFEGKLLTSKTYHNAGSNRTVTTTNSVQYDVAGRTTAVLSSSAQPINQQSQQPFSSTAIGQSVQWGSVVGLTVSAGSLTRASAVTGSWDAGAFSTQSIPANSEGWIEFTMSDNNSHKMLGLSSTNTDAGYATINYALYGATNSVLMVYENGTGTDLGMPYTSTDVFRVERIGTSIVYRKNGTIIRTSPTPSSGALFADCSIYTTASGFNNISIGIGHSNNVNVTLNGNILTKTAGAIGGWNAGAFSLQSIPASMDGWLEFTAGETNAHKMMGLSGADGGVGYETINYVFYGLVDGTLAIYENGTPVANLGTFSVTDLFRIERVGTRIYYKRNGVSVFTSNMPSSGALYADCSLYNINASFKNISMGISPWKNTTGVTISGTTLTKTGGSGAAWDAGVFSNQSIPANTNGFVEFTAGETITDKMMGLSATDVDANYTHIAYAMYPASDGNIYIDESGAAKNNGAPVGSYTTSDVLRVERSGTSILYKRNGAVLWTTTGASTSTLYADCSLKTANVTIKNISMGVNDIQVANYQYNELGQLVDKKLHSTDGANFLQSVDYRYSIRGWLASINNANLDVNGANNDEVNDYFGMELLYNSVDNNLGTTPCYNGNVSTIKWKGVGTPSGYDAIHSYRYIYDKANRLKTAVSQIYSSAANSWVKETGALNETITYDLNGNIQTLQRNTRQYNMTMVNGVPTVAYNQSQMDNLAYTYNSTMGDQLLTVTDATSNASGFDNGSSGTNTDYTYDANGSLTSDLNKGISNIVYNHLSKPTSIVYTDGRHVEYTYDAAGTKLTMKAYAAGGPLQTTTDYVGGFVYTNNKLDFFSSPEGRVANNNGNLEYQYAIADQQGNTRVVFTSINPTKDPDVATFEDAVADSKVFQNVNTSSTYWVSKFGANNTSGGQYSLRMNNSYPVGPSKSLKVFPGDVINLEAWSYFEGSSGFGSSDLSLNALVTSVAAAFGGISGAVGESGKIFTGINAAYSASGAPVNQSDADPTAHLNYILFDKDYNFLTAGWQGVPSTANLSKQKISFSPINIKEAGYMFVYLSYEGDGVNWVYFDDLKITHTKTNVVQYNEYYPFGLQASTSWTRDNSTNNFLYNEGSELNASSGWYDLPFRNYDPVLGRFVQIDPLAHQQHDMSPYQYAGNSPVNSNDPSGLKFTGAGAGRPTWLNDLNSEFEMGGMGLTEYEENQYEDPNGNESYNTSDPNQIKKIIDAFKRGNASNVDIVNGYIQITNYQHYYNNNNIAGYKAFFSYVEISQTRNLIAAVQGNPYAEQGPWIMSAQAILGFVQFGLETISHTNKPLYTGPNAWNALKGGASKLGTVLGVVGVGVSIVDGITNKDGWQNHHTADVAIGLGLTGATLLAGTATVAAFIPGVNIAVAVIGLTYFAVDLAVQIGSEDHQSITQKLFD